jgi:uncharacterized membrane protein YjjB (DUF3815 family)
MDRTRVSGFIEMSLAAIVQETLCGAVAAAGFGVLFNVSPRRLPLCAASGALALAVRTGCLEAGLNLEGASFAAALSISVAVQLLRTSMEISPTTLDVVGCIPMIPGSLAAKAILGLFATATSTVVNAQQLVTAVQYTISVAFVIGAIGTGLAIPTLLLRLRLPRNRRNSEAA